MLLCFKDLHKRTPSLEIYDDRFYSDIEFIDIKVLLEYLS